MLLEKPKLFTNTREFIVVIGFLIVIVSVRLGWTYYEYREFVTKPFYYTQAVVLQQYTKQKWGRPYEVLKLKSQDGYEFYTTAHLKDNLSGYSVRIKLMPDESIGFWEYQRAFYIKAKIKKVYEKLETVKSQLLEKIASQHKNNHIISFYQAIFLATPIDKELREIIAMLGVSHLVALSGFHLTILWGLVFGLLHLFYRPLQQRYFPYRYSLLDLGLITVVLLGFYLWFVGSPPSLVRSFTMLSIAWVLLLLGIELVSFYLLGFVILLLLALFPLLISSLGFWFSVAGVFYIFLLLHWTKDHNKWLINLLYIPFGIFLLMLPIVHTVFGVTTLWQLLSPLLSLLFIPFYPLAIALHLVGFGGVLDDSLIKLFALPKMAIESILSIEMVLGYLLVSIFSIGSRIFFVLTLLLALLYFGYLYLFI